MSAARIIVFAKAPVAGRVKTRLCPPLQPGEAARLHARMVRQTLEAACAAAPSGVELHCAPSPADGFFADCARRHRVSLHRQIGDDIGMRMAHALRDASRGNPLLLIGTDCPARNAADLRAAAGALEAGAQAVLGPVDDGGYSLIGLARFEARIFADIDWGGMHVTSQTLARFAALNLRWNVLPTLWDVDRPADLTRLHSAFPELLEGIRLHAPMPG